MLHILKFCHLCLDFYPKILPIKIKVKGLIYYKSGILLE